MYINGKLVWGEEPDGTKAVPGADIENNGGNTTPTNPPETPTNPPVNPTEPPVQPTEPPTQAPTGNPGGSTKAYYGDANCDEVISMADAAAIFQALGNPDKYSLSEQGAVNADVNGVKGLTPDDALVIMQVAANMVKQEELPLKK
jgi:hypothetical protein